MSPASEPMTFDELSELYRVEMKSSSITQVRGVLFRAMAELLTRLRIEFDKQMSIDPESVMCEGANQRRKKAERLVKDIMHIRTQKICQMAIRGALGAENQLDALTGLLNQNSYLNRTAEMRSSGGLLIAFDVDSFKQINDCYGHLQGNACLAAIAACLKKAYANDGYCYRIGGDEFCVLLKNAAKEAACKEDFCIQILDKSDFVRCID